MAITKKIILIKLITIILAVVLGILFNYFFTSHIARNLVQSGNVRSIIMLIGQQSISILVQSNSNMLHGDCLGPLPWRL